MNEQYIYADRPSPQKGPEVPYQNDGRSNPVLRGPVLPPLALLIRSSTWLQSTLWRLNNFHKLKDIPNLDTHAPRYDPTVVSMLSEYHDVFNVSELAGPKPRRSVQQYYTCADYHELYKSKKITPFQVAEYLLSVVSRPAKGIKPDKYSVAYRETRAELVLVAARASTERYEKGQFLSVLDGVPVAVKDEIEVRGYSKMQGSSLDFTNPKHETGWCVRLWEEAGAVVIGKTNMHEMGMDTNGFNSVWGTPLNPHNSEYYTGGSSSGSACTVAQGICPISLGADGGGSIRIPASFCGLYGLKTTHGRVSGSPTAGLANSVGVYGPIASSVEDLALAYRIMAQPEIGNVKNVSFSSSLSKPKASSGDGRQQRPPKKVIGIDRDWVARSDPEVLEMFERAVKVYARKCGYEVVDISLPYLPEGQKAHALTILSEVRSGLSSAQISQLSYQNQVLLTAAGSQASALDFIAAQRLRGMLMQHLAWLWDRYPQMLILTPTTPCAGWKVGHPNDVAFRGWGASDSDTSLRTMEFIYVANWTGVPAMTMPMGYTVEDDVPVGLMAMGEWGREEQLLAWAGEGVDAGVVCTFDDDLDHNDIRRPKPEGSWIDVLERAAQFNV